MISEFNQSECFVYINLPGETRPVTVGKLVIRPDKSGLPHGMFVYGRSYLDRQDKVPIDPIELKLSDRVYETRALKGVFGAFQGSHGVSVAEVWRRCGCARPIFMSQNSELHAKIDP